MCIYRCFRPTPGEDEDWYDPTLNPFSDNNLTESEVDDHYETIDDVQLAVAELQKKEQALSDSKKPNMPKVDPENRTSSGYSGIGGEVSQQKVRPPRPKRPASIISAEKQAVTSVETQTSFEKEETSNTVIPKIVISENKQTNQPSAEEAKT